MDDAPIGVALLRQERMRGWFHRYLPAEIVGTSAALAAAGLAASGGVERAVVAAAWAEAIAFYLFVTARELRRIRAEQRSGAVFLALRDVVAEFGVAEAADTIVLRPLLMFACAALFGGVIPGVIAGKLASDVIFYALAIPAYELRERGRA